MVLLVAALAVLLGTFGVAPTRSDAQDQLTCPAGSTLNAEKTLCVVDTSGTNPNVTTTTSCTQGVLSDDGKSCVVPRLDAAPAPAAAAAAPAAAATTPSAPTPSFTG